MLSNNRRIMYTSKEKLLAILLLETVKRANLTPESEMKAITLAGHYATAGSDLTVLKVLEYPDTTRANT
jgi:hypothetical protein